MDRVEYTDYRLGGVLIDGVGRRLLLADSRERLPADTQQVEVLLCLVRSYPAIVSKDELLEQVWGGRYVTDAALHKTVSTLRKLLREHHDGADLIETRYRRGYQLLQPAVAVPALPAGAAAVVAPAGVTDGLQTARPARTRAPRLALAAGLVLVGVAAWLWWPRVPDPAPPQPVVTAPAVAESLARMDDEALVQAIKDALVPDPQLARQAAAELRRRGENAPRLRGLADKFDGIVAYRAGDFATAESAYLRALPAFRRSPIAARRPMSSTTWRCCWRRPATIPIAPRRCIVRPWRSGSNSVTPPACSAVIATCPTSCSRPSDWTVPAWRWRRTRKRRPPPERRATSWKRASCVAT